MSKRLLIPGEFFFHVRDLTFKSNTLTKFNNSQRDQVRNLCSLRCTDDLIFESKTVGVGDDVKLTCTRPTSDYDISLFWIRLVSGKFPEILGGTFAFDYDGVNDIPRITAKQEPGTFLLHISEAELSDTGVYYCMKVQQIDMKFVTGTYLRIKVPPSNPVRPGDSVAVQCSVLSDSEKTTCPGDHSVYWFRAGAGESHPSLIYAHGNNDDQCEKSPEAPSTQKCVYNFSKIVNSSDAGTHYCAVATCGEILFGNGMKLDIEGNCRVFQYNCEICIFLYLIFESVEDPLVYSAATFTRRKAGKAERRKEKTAKGETVYTDVRAFVTD
uniref:Ig-like domain-containing protein n=1 Tax=Seriola dumerili TaxID=41447 RepID=A0A3B4TDI7_SERDU